MAKRRPLARSRTGKKAYKRRQRRQALRQAGETLVGLIPGMGLMMSARNLGEAYNKFQRNRERR